MKIPLASTLLLMAAQMTAQVFDNMTIDSISSGLRPIDPKLALDMPIVMSFNPLTDVSGKDLFIGTLYDMNTNIDETGWDKETEFRDLGYVVYDQIRVGETETFYEARCFTFQYMDMTGDITDAVTLCITQEYVDYLLETGGAHVEGNEVIVTRPLRTARGYSGTVHVRWIEDER